MGYIRATHRNLCLAMYGSWWMWWCYPRWCRLFRTILPKRSTWWLVRSDFSLKWSKNDFSTNTIGSFECGCSVGFTHGSTDGCGDDDECLGEGNAYDPTFCNPDLATNPDHCKQCQFEPCDVVVDQRSCLQEIVLKLKFFTSSLSLNPEKNQNAGPPPNHCIILYIFDALDFSANRAN